MTSSLKRLTATGLFAASSTAAVITATPGDQQKSPDIREISPDEVNPSEASAAQSQDRPAPAITHEDLDDRYADFGGSLRMDYFFNRINGGDEKPDFGQQIIGEFQLGPRLDLLLRYDLGAEDAFHGRAHGRLENAELTVKIGDLDDNPLKLTGGLMGEQVLFESANFQPGGKHSLLAGYPLYDRFRIDNPHIVGLKAEKAFDLSDEWSLIAEARAFTAYDDERTRSRIEDRGNSSDLSFAGKLTALREDAKGSLAFGVHAAKIAQGQLVREQDETYFAAFGKFERAIGSNMTWSGVGEVVYFDNAVDIDATLNSNDQDRLIIAAHTALEWEINRRLLAYGQVGAVHDSRGHDVTLMAALGARLKLIEEGNFSLYGFGEVGYALPTGGDYPVQVRERDGLETQFGLMGKLEF